MSKPMKTQDLPCSQVALAQDLPEHHLKRGNIATVVEHYPYSLEGFGVPDVTVEVAAS
jgi:hypothetical protein